MFPSLKMIVYMDDVVLSGDLNIVEKATASFLTSCAFIGGCRTASFKFLKICRLGTFITNNAKFHCFCIKTIDGASVAAIASDTFFNAEENNFIFNLDFKNAFNSVKQETIFEVIKFDFPELSSFFYHFYGKESDLIFNSFGLKSTSGVKQGDPLGPLLFCLAIHKTLNIIKQKYPSIKIVAYMDDISLIGSFDLLELVAQEIADSYENIGLHLNASKCLLIGSSALLSLGSHYERVASSAFVLGEMDFLDVDL
ncbi:hypothetical protein P9112_012711 [Eukaryota sp. TZLM1-RC]